MQTPNMRHSKRENQLDSPILFVNCDMRLKGIVISPASCMEWFVEHIDKQVPLSHMHSGLCIAKPENC